MLGGDDGDTYTHAVFRHRAPAPIATGHPSSAIAAPSHSLSSEVAFRMPGRSTVMLFPAPRAESS